jgi:hypothetical protein
MNANPDHDSPVDPPLGRAFRLKELPGLIAKSMDVPPRRQGVVIYANEKIRLLPPGRQRILSPLERLRGLGAGLNAGYVPAGGFTAWFKASNLLSGDGELIDAGLLCEVQPAEPAAFFREIVLPRGVVHAEGIDLGSEPVFHALEALVQRYAALDLARSLPTERLLPEVLSYIGPALAAQSLRLSGIHFLSFHPSNQRAEIAEKALALDERLQDAAMQQKMLAVENQAQFEDFVRQLDPAFLEDAGLRLGSPPEPGPAANNGQKIPFADRLRSALKLETKSGQPWRITQLWRKQAPAAAQTPARRPRNTRWWLPRTIWIGIVLLTVYLLTSFVFNLSERLGWENPWEVLSVLWAFGLGAVLESIKALYEKREEIGERPFTEAGTTFLDDLTRNNRERIDALVRESCGRELAHSREMLNELRGRVYRQGDEDLALKLRTLEQKFERAQSQILDPRFGAAPYLGDLKINRRTWEEMLDFDEELLVRAAALAEDARRIQQDLSLAQPDPGLLDAQQDRLDGFLHQFETRSRALRSSMEAMAAYRIQ